MTCKTITHCRNTAVPYSCCSPNTPITLFCEDGEFTQTSLANATPVIISGDPNVQTEGSPLNCPIINPCNNATVGSGGSCG